MDLKNPFLKFGLTSVYVEAFVELGIDSLRQRIERHYRETMKSLQPDIAKGSRFDVAGFNAAKTAIELADDEQLLVWVREFISLGNPIAKQMRYRADDQKRVIENTARNVYAAELERLKKLEEFVDCYFGSGRIGLTSRYTTHLGTSTRAIAGAVFFDGVFCHYIDHLARVRTAEIKLPPLDEDNLTEVEMRFVKAINWHADTYRRRGLLRRMERLDRQEAIESKADRGLFDTDFGLPWQFFAPVVSSYEISGKVLAGFENEAEFSFNSLDEVIAALPPTKTRVEKWDRIILFQVIGTKKVYKKETIPAVTWRVRVTRSIIAMNGPYTTNASSVSGPLIIGHKCHGLPKQLQFSFSRKHQNKK